MPHPRNNPGAALITGAAKRIGRSIALHLARQGYTIAIHCHRSIKAARQLKSEIVLNGGRAEIFSADLSDPKEAVKLIAKVRQRFPSLNVLINNASQFERSSLNKIKMKTIQQDFQIHLFTPLLLTQAFSKHCRKGTIINILDSHITRQETKHFSYLLSKKSLADLTQMSALSLAPYIRVNAIALGLILPPAGQTTDYLDRLAQRIPLKRKGEVADILKGVDFLLENSFVTGETLFIDGGEHLYNEN